MADTKNTFTLTNTSEGPRGFWEGADIVMLDPKQAAQADLSDAEHKAAKDTGYFKIKAGPLDHDSNGSAGGSEPASPPSLAGKTKAELLKIAEDEGVTVEDGATNDDIKSAIELHREG